MFMRQIVEANLWDTKWVADETKFDQNPHVSEDLKAPKWINRTDSFPAPNVLLSPLPLNSIRLQWTLQYTMISTWADTALSMRLTWGLY